MSRTICTYPITGALDKADEFLGPDRTWHAVNDTQRRFLGNHFVPCRRELGRIPEIESTASRDHAVINRFLRERKFAIALNPFPPDGFGTASVLDVTGKWRTMGTVRPLNVPDLSGEVPGVFLTRHVTFSLSRLGVIAHAMTESGDVANFALMPDGPSKRQAPDDLALMELVATERTGLRTYDALHFPMVNLDVQPDISWMLELWTNDDAGDRFKVAQAVQQTKLKMNQFGFRAKSGVALGIMRTSVQPRPRPYVIDRPFLFWIERRGLARPFLVAWITPDDFRDPGSLDDM
ncbi:MAG TPA: hypothetical protein VD862_00430 [Candidatus Paceibacterota bacterium]|nr:hypothetical protein [Candidatus Paceibacterota bacterium]